jgi:NhaP-type Na+/H+ or K+/H+ antiporter
MQMDASMQVFYSLLLPPIVFYAGFSVKKKLFFKNLVTIAIFGILGCNLTGVFPASIANH